MFFNNATGGCTRTDFSRKARKALIRKMQDRYMRQKKKKNAERTGLRQTEADLSYFGSKTPL